MAYTGPAVGVANWIKNGANTATYQAATGTPSVAAKGVIVPLASVALSSGTVIKDTNYTDDIRDFLVGTLDSVYNVYSAQTGTAIPTNFIIQKALSSNKVQYIVTVTTNGDVDFPTLA